MTDHIKELEGILGRPVKEDELLLLENLIDRRAVALGENAPSSDRDRLNTLITEARDRYGLDENELSFLYEDFRCQVSGDSDVQATTSVGYGMKLLGSALLGVLQLALWGGIAHAGYSLHEVNEGHMRDQVEGVVVGIESKIVEEGHVGRPEGKAHVANYIFYVENSDGVYTFDVSEWDCYFRTCFSGMLKEGDTFSYDHRFDITREELFKIDSGDIYDLKINGKRPLLCKLQ
ncbi:hypothetical protein HOA92_07430 [archaeon]|nr:hypothetical protein [archaeon]MBT6762845.1 hypothetical protein [archaeon]